MKAKHILTTIGLVLTGAVFVGNSATALTAQDEAALEFTFEPVLTLTVSDPDLIISNLNPGVSRMSNTIDITVETNSVGGYLLSATTGNAQNATRNLVLDASHYFESIATGASVSTLSDGTWGYTIDNGTSYSGIALYTGTATTVNSSNGPVNAATGTTQFAIGAKASAVQASGNYTNVINFTAVAKPVQ